MYLKLPKHALISLKSIHGQWTAGLLKFSSDNTVLHVLNSSYSFVFSVFVNFFLNPVLTVSFIMYKILACRHIRLDFMPFYNLRVGPSSLGVSSR